MESCLKLWWEGTPQVVDVDWNIFEIEGQKTRIETRFGTHKAFRTWSWNVMITFAFLLMTSGLLCRRLVESSQQLATASNALGSNGTITMLLVLALLGFAAKSYHVKYDSSLSSFWGNLENKGILPAVDPGHWLISENCSRGISYSFLKVLVALFSPNLYISTNNLGLAGLCI